MWHCAAKTTDFFLIKKDSIFTIEKNSMARCISHDHISYPWSFIYGSWEKILCELMKELDFQDEIAAHSV